MIEIPPWALLHAAKSGPKAVEELVEWCLSVEDVSSITGATKRTVINWINKGRGNVKLPARSFSTGPGGRAAQWALRLQDVESYATFLGIALDYHTLPRVLREKYRVAEFAPTPTYEAPL